MKKIKDYRNICQKQYIENEKEFGVKLMLRHVSIYFSIFFIYFKFKPNTVTILSILLGFLSSFQYYNGEFLIGSTLLLIAIILDFSDGEVSRYFKSGSLEGEYLDLILHWILHPIILASLTLYVLKFENFNFIFLIFGFSAVIGSIIISLVRTYAKYIVLYLNISKLKTNNDSLSFSNNSNNSLKNIISKIFTFYDFPYIMLIAIIASLIEQFSSLNSIFYLICFLGITFPIVIIFFIYLNVKNKRITNFNN